MFIFVTQHGRCCVKHFSHMSHLTAGCEVRKCSFTSFCFSKLELQAEHENFLCLMYFLFNLYSTVLNTFFWGSVSVGFSILIAVPIIRGSIGGLVSVSGPPLMLGCACCVGGAQGEMGNVMSSSSLGLSSGKLSILASSFKTLKVSCHVAGVVIVLEVLATALGCVSVLPLVVVRTRTDNDFLAGHGVLAGFVLYFSAAIRLADGFLFESTMHFHIWGWGGSSVKSNCA